jgi:hypothetical protein
MESVNEPMLPPPEASAYLRAKHGLRRSIAALAKIRCVCDDGPEFVKVGRSIYYPTPGLDEYALRSISAPRRSTRLIATAHA